MSFHVNDGLEDVNVYVDKNIVIAFKFVTIAAVPKVWSNGMNDCHDTRVLSVMGVIQVCRRSHRSVRHIIDPVDCVTEG